MRTGELFILGFRGLEIPQWLLQFEKQFGLGGVILFDYNCQSKTYENNIQNPQQVKELCNKISALPSRPLIFVDQEGGKVRRLKESKGFAALPSALKMNTLPENERKRFLQSSFKELRQLGIDFNFAPVIDLNFNPANPDIGVHERSFSAVASEVELNTKLVNDAGLEHNLGLCLKHYPGLGGATANSHTDLTDLSDSINENQLDLFYKWGKQISGEAILISHGIVKQWDKILPVSMSKKALDHLRSRLPEALLISDDMQMQGLLKKLSSFESHIQGIKAGLDMLCIGNNLIAEDGDVLKSAVQLTTQKDLHPQLQKSIARVQQRKNKFKQSPSLDTVLSV